MRISFHELDTKSIRSFLARIAPHCTVTLSTGTKITFNRSIRERNYFYVGTLTSMEKVEFFQAKYFMGMRF